MTELDLAVGVALLIVILRRPKKQKKVKSWIKPEDAYLYGLAGGVDPCPCCGLVEDDFGGDRRCPVCKRVERLDR